ncbi:MAG: hypothetical protein Rubg2KO_41020 [Rubricoccaceae bacterium]
MALQSTLRPETRVGHVRDDAGAVEVYVGRGTLRGNPSVARAQSAATLRCSPGWPTRADEGAGRPQ